MVGVNKYTPTGKHIIKDIYLSFYYGAKIGIIGLNGSGKSTLLQLLAQYTLPNSGKVEMPQVEAENVYAQITYAAPYVELIEEYTLVEHLEL